MLILKHKCDKFNCILYTRCFILITLLTQARKNCIYIINFYVVKNNSHFALSSCSNKEDKDFNSNGEWKIFYDEFLFPLLFIKFFFNHKVLTTSLSATNSSGTFSKESFPESRKERTVALLSCRKSL